MTLLLATCRAASLALYEEKNEAALTAYFWEGSPGP